MSRPLRERLVWNDGAVHDADRRYLLMRPDVLMGALVRLDPASRAALATAWVDAARVHGGASLSAYAQAVNHDAQALIGSTVAAAADLGWGRWDLRATPSGLALEVHDSPFVAGWRGATPQAADAPVCAPVRGLLAALAGLLLPGPLVIEETHCAAVHGGGTCRFEARR